MNLPSTRGVLSRLRACPHTITCNPSSPPQPSRARTLEPSEALSSHASAAKLTTTLTEENVQFFNKLEQYGGKADPLARIWRWLYNSGPPFDSNPSGEIP
jgi:hypothetical protein